jgi:hypothetical protein
VVSAQSLGPRDKREDDGRWVEDGQVDGDEKKNGATYQLAPAPSVNF